uniref:Zmp:0000001267 n=1 Tax=Oryzias melastigma TaxID=30732 RepID=A0A3B3BUK4_ORYME
MTGVWAAEALAFDCHPNHNAPAPSELPCRWWAHWGVIPRRSFGLDPTGVRGRSPGHQAYLDSSDFVLDIMADNQPGSLKLRKEIGLLGAVALVSGCMIGSGIFMSPQFVLVYVGSPGASLVIWAISGVVAMFAAFSYTELGMVIPESGGEFIYILRIYGPFPAFFAAINFILLAKPCSIAIMGISIAKYITAPFYPECHPPQLAVKCTAAVFILVVAILNSLNSLSLK